MPGRRKRVARLVVTARYVGQVALAAVAVGAAALLIGPKLLGWEGVVVLTGSMEPTLDAGGIAFLDRVPPEKIRVGDVMTFTRMGSRQQVTHRVTEVTATSRGPMFRTKGDANELADTWTVTPGQVVGKVRLALPRFGGASRLLADGRDRLALLMAVAAAVLVADEVRRAREHRRALRRWWEEDAQRVACISARRIGT